MGQAGALLRLLRQRVATAAAEDGLLLVDFADGSTLRVEPRDQYESWGIVGAGRVYQCLPGGEIGSW